MESDGEFPPIHPRAPLNHAQADIEAQSSRMQSQSSHMTNDNPIYEKMGSATKNGNRRRKKYFCGICGLFILIFVVVLVLAIRADWFLVKNNNTLPTNSNQTKSSTYSQLAATRPENMIKAVGDGDVVMNLFAGESVQPWKLESSQGNCSLQSKKFIIAQPSGSYHVSCKVELHKKAAKLKLKVIRNRAPVKFVNFCEMAGKPLVYAPEAGCIEDIEYVNDQLEQRNSTACKIF